MRRERLEFFLQDGFFCLRRPQQKKPCGIFFIEVRLAGGQIARLEFLNAVSPEDVYVLAGIRISENGKGQVAENRSHDGMRG